MARVAKEDVFERVRKHFGWGPNSLSLYGDIERGKRVLTDDDKKVLAAVYGKKPSDVPEAPIVDTPPTLAAALSDLAVELRELRQERTSLKAEVEQLQGLVRRLYELVPGAGPTPRVPDGTAG